MKIWTMSDLHLEFSPDWELPAPRPQFDVLVIAGDLITRMERGVRWLHQRITDKLVIYVPGNHEGYSADIDRTVEKAREAAIGSNIRILQNELVDIEGVRFTGCTLWTDWCLNGNPEAAMSIAQEEMNDYKRIRKGRYAYRLRPRDTLLRHQQSCAFLAQTLSQPFRGKTVVISHHAPTRAACDVSAGAAPEILDAAYRSDLRYLMEFTHPDIWIHGHVHESTDRMVGRTRLIANARGYPDEPNPDFDPRLTIEI
jgi:Icc-related predicted phosphoesterase